MLKVYIITSAGILECPYALKEDINYVKCGVMRNLRHLSVIIIYYLQ